MLSSLLDIASDIFVIFSEPTVAESMGIEDSYCGSCASYSQMMSSHGNSSLHNLVESSSTEQ